MFIISQQLECFWPAVVACSFYWHSFVHDNC